MRGMCGIRDGVCLSRCTGDLMRMGTRGHRHMRGTRWTRRLMLLWHMLGMLREGGTRCRHIPTRTRIEILLHVRITVSLHTNVSDTAREMILIPDSRMVVPTVKEAGAYLVVVDQDVDGISEDLRAQLTSVDPQGR